MISQSRLQELLSYDPDTGIFRWLPGTKLAGAIAGSRAVLGYWVIGVADKSYKAHRLAHLYMTGAFPTDQIDHINGNREDNRWVNLRPATNTENARNASVGKNNTSGFKGVSYHKDTGKYQARIMVDRQLIHLGIYDTAEDAHAVYSAAAKDLHGKFARVS
ncbi:MAG: HNH endonuclease [Mesorhizobium sp.]|nr:MAG: HNH endonuclease [Mesorhizobium sp.]